MITQNRIAEVDSSRSISNGMKKLFVSGLLSVLLFPALASAAYNDVRLTTSAILNIGSISLQVYGDGATLQSITVGSSNFTFVMLESSTLTVRSLNAYTLSHNAPSSMTVTPYCSASESRLGIEVASGNATGTVSVTPSTTVCTSTSGGSGGSSGSSGGGGGGGGTVAVTATTQTSTQSTPSTIAQLQAQLNVLLAQLAALKGGATATAGARATFARDLKVGLTGADVKALQVYLNAKGYVVAKSGPGSAGTETTRFGSATRAALVKLQKAAGITPAAGYFGAKTRAYVAANP